MHNSFRKLHIQPQRQKEQRYATFYRAKKLNNFLLLKFSLKIVYILISRYKHQIRFRITILNSYIFASNKDSNIISKISKGRKKFMKKTFIFIASCVYSLLFDSWRNSMYHLKSVPYFLGRFTIMHIKELIII